MAARGGGRAPTPDHSANQLNADELARLTRREHEVAILIATGLTNAEIANRLVIVPGTVANYVERILRKLDLRSRTQIAVWAVEHGLYRSNGEGDDEAEPPLAR